MDQLKQTGGLQKPISETLKFSIYLTPSLKLKDLCMENLKVEFCFSPWNYYNTAPD